MQERTITDLTDEELQAMIRTLDKTISELPSKNSTRKYYVDVQNDIKKQLGDNKKI